jgi:hypothetical protein
VRCEPLTVITTSDEVLGYMGYSVAVLIPIFAIVTVIFFL